MLYYLCKIKKLKHAPAHLKFCYKFLFLGYILYIKIWALIFSMNVSWRNSDTYLLPHKSQKYRTLFIKLFILDSSKLISCFARSCKKFGWFADYWFVTVKFRKFEPLRILNLWFDNSRICNPIIRGFVIQIKAVTTPTTAYAIQSDKILYPQTLSFLNFVFL